MPSLLHHTEEQTPAIRSALELKQAQVMDNCSQCRICVSQCRFLQTYGTPKSLLSGKSDDQKKQYDLAFECHLCGLCTAVCPHEVDPTALFLEMRRTAFKRGEANHPEHRGLRFFESISTSKQFTGYFLPRDCDTIFFPGCALSGSRSQLTAQIYQHLQVSDPRIGIVLDCCSKLSHDLGNSALFSTRFNELQANLKKQGIKKILVACPSCQKIFTDHADDIEIITIYEHLNENPNTGLLQTDAETSETIMLHDPCVTRFFETTQNAVRSLLKNNGYRIVEPIHCGQQTICCGEGGGVKSLVPENSERLQAKRVEESNGHPIVSYCAACSAAFASKARSYHILDLLFQNGDSHSDKSLVAKGSATYFHRLKLKQKLRRDADTKTQIYNRKSINRSPKNQLSLKKIALILCLTLAIFVIRSYGGIDYLEQDKLQQWIAGYGNLAPLVYMLIYTAAPIFLLPGLPIGIVGGLIFGPFWGVVYTITSATAGASLAFLISRYLARGLVKDRLEESRWQNLSLEVNQNGWKIVALTRLVPLFPYNLLNYAFGLTSISFRHYCLATFIFMLPGVIACITLSSSLTALLGEGQLTPSFFIGVCLLGALSLLPLAYRRLKRGSK